MKIYCDNPFGHKRRETREVMVGNVGIGGTNPIRVQSMITSDTMDTRASVKQVLDLAKAGCEIVRITAPTRKDAANLKNIRDEVRAAGCDVPLVADIHFKPEAAMEAAQWVEKVRINPGNFADRKKFQTREYTDEQYEEELERIEETFLPLLNLCRERKVALRIGTNHGSLSDRIMNRYGDTPLGMVESALEFARICRKYDFHHFVFSMKASNPKVMINAYRLLVAKTRELGEDWNYPLHLGVTEAGEGEDGRIKSAIGIGSLLADGIGETIRVSLTEDAIHEVPVARALVHFAAEHAGFPAHTGENTLAYDPYAYAKRGSLKIKINGTSIGGDQVPRVVTRKKDFEELQAKRSLLGETLPEVPYETSAALEVDVDDPESIRQANEHEAPALVTVKDGTCWSPLAAFRLLASKVHPRHPILLKDTLTPGQDKEQSSQEALLKSAAYLGALLCDGIGDAVLVRREQAPIPAVRLSYNILQASGNRTFKTDYVACPSCGRTLFDLQQTTARIRQSTEHLKGVKIAVMGCIVNGPGEMADADFGYVGGAPGKINLYVGKTPVKFNIPEAEAVDRLADLIKEHGKWVDPPLAAITAGVEA